MSNPVSFAANGDPFRGGSFTPGTVPNLGGAIAAAATGSSLQGSVTDGQPMLARNNRGSNVTIPYARVVMHPSTNTALPPTPLETEGAETSTVFAGDRVPGARSNDSMVETEALFSGRVAFVLGRRGKGYTNPGITGVSASFSTGTPRAVPFRQANQLAAFAAGGSDVNTMQRMCSFEYLQRYFYFALKSKLIVLGGGGAAGDFPVGMGLSPDVRKVATARIIGKGSMTSVDGNAILSEIAARNSLSDNLPAKKNNLANSGIFLADNGPFLRGKTLETTLSKIGNNKAPVPASIGDVVAFGRLQELIVETGACDWVPDGIVHSKLSQGDKIMDDELDARDGQLYNVTVGGPAIASSWTNDKHLEVMPLDKVFVVIVADVWDATGAASVGAHHTTNDDGAYEHELLKAATKSRTDAEQGAYFKSTNEKAVITNMRVRLTTSSEMVSCSHYKGGGGNRSFPPPGADKAASKTVYYSMPRERNSRMGLVLGGDRGVSEYIIGGWCIGTVLDSAAARSSMGGVPLVGAVKRQRTQHASNVKVKVEWWSADRLYRSYMNVKGGLRTRYNGVQNELAVVHGQVALSKALSRPLP